MLLKPSSRYEGPDCSSATLASAKAVGVLREIVLKGFSMALSCTQLVPV